MSQPRPDEYWRQFQATVSFLEPCEVIGTLEARGKLETREGPAPQLRIRLDNDCVVIVNAVQTRLLAELVRLQPAIGDRIKIVYRGQTSKAAPGMNPTKEFHVAVRSAGSPTVDAATGEVPQTTPSTDPTADRGAAVDAPGPDPETATPVDGPTPPASTDPAAASGPGPDEPSGYVDQNGKVHVPAERADVTAVKARIAALTVLEKEAFRGWLVKAKIPDSIEVSEAKVRAVNAELDRRGAVAEATT